MQTRSFSCFLLKVAKLFGLVRWGCQSALMLQTTMWQGPLKYLEGVSCYSHPALAIPHVCEHGLAWKVHASCLLLSHSSPPNILRYMSSLSVIAASGISLLETVSKCTQGGTCSLRETMTSALVPSRESLCIRQPRLSRNRSVLTPRVPCACVKLAMFGSTCSSLPRRHVVTMNCWLWGSLANGQLGKCVCAQAPRCHHQCFSFRLWANSF